MASMEELKQTSSGTEKVKEMEENGSVENIANTHQNNDEIKKRKNKKKRYATFVPKFGCLRLKEEEEKNGYPTKTTIVVEESAADGSLSMEAEAEKQRSPPTHLVVMVNGIIGSAQNWRFAAKQFVKKYPQDVIVHCSESNTSMLTFDGVDVMGARLADEVTSFINSHPALQKISFIGHSLGGLIARYAIAKLYEQDFTNKAGQENGKIGFGESTVQSSGEKLKGKIGGLEPINFITFATPHLGSRGHRQVPVFCGLYAMEKTASRVSWFLGRTGKHLFLTDKDDGKPPLLLQMVHDREDLKFISALQAFRRRVAYANVQYDHLVGWSTSSLRRRKELPKRQHLSRNSEYRHIVNVETAKIASPDVEVSSGAEVNVYKTDDMEEAMIRSLTKLSWERVDVNFKGTKQKYFAHNTIQVKSYCINSDGADVVRHMVDNFLL